MHFLQSHAPAAKEEEEEEEELKKKKKIKDMREEEDHANWFSRWEEQLPSPEELTPLTQTLITPDLAVAFDITPNRSPPLPPSSNPPPSSSSDFADSAGPDEPARTLKRPRLVWTPQLHKRFVDAVAQLGIKNAVPKTIMQLMNVDGLTRENVASHLQKYRLYLKRMQGFSAGAGATDAAADRLFASAPIPHHFLHRTAGPPSGVPGGGEHYLPFVPVAAIQQHHHQMAVAAAAQQQQQRHMGHFGSPPGGQFEHGFLARGPQSVHRMVSAVPPGPSYAEDLESGVGAGGKKVLTLFPTGDD